MMSPVPCFNPSVTLPITSMSVPITTDPTYPCSPSTPATLIPTSYYPMLFTPVLLPGGWNVNSMGGLPSINSSVPNGLSVTSTGTLPSPVPGVSFCPITPSNRTDVVVEWSAPEWSAPRRCHGLNGSVPNEHVIREGRIHRCPHCQALLFKEELTAGPLGRFGRCCSNDNYRLPTLPSPPEELLRIFRQPTYRAMSRNVNHALAFACWKCNEDKSLMGRYHAISCIRVQGCAYVLVGAVEPSDSDARLKYIQVFFNSNNEEEAITRTAENANIDPTRKNIEWIRSLHHWIRDNNPIYDVYQQVKEVHTTTQKRGR